MKHIRKWQDRLAPPLPLRYVVTAVAALFSGLVWAFLITLVETQSIRLSLTRLADADAPLWLTAFFLGLVLAALTFLLHSFFLGNLLVGVPVLLLAFVNYFKLLITLTPLTVGDFSLAGQVGNIAGLNSASLFVSRNSALAIAAGVCWLLLALFLSRPLRLPWARSLPLGAGCLLAFALFFWAGADGLVFSPLGVPAGSPVSQLTANQSCGMPLGLWRALYRSLTQDVTAGYSPEHMELAVRQAEEYAASLPEPEDRAQPNIILVLSESFFDVTELEGVSFETDPLARFHALQQESVSGTFYTRSLGYGTCNIELEIMTGLNTGLFSGEDLYGWDPVVFSYLPAVPALLEEEGYYTSMVHMFNDSIYHRGDFFPFLGFRDLFFTGDFAEIYPPAAEAEDYYGYLARFLSGGIYSDDFLAQLLISQYEARHEDAPLFLYGVSMESHQPFPADKYSPEELTVQPLSSLTGEAADILRTYSQGASNASAALGRLADYFRDCGEPTVIVFYGDHRPGLGLAEGGTVYSALGAAPGQGYLWSTEDKAWLYSTDYLIWSNDPDYLPGEPGEVRDTSCSYLGAQLLELAGAELPLYWRTIAQLSRTRTADALDFHIDRTGTLSALPPDRGEDALGLSLLRDFIYDAVYGQRYVTDRVGR